MITISLKSITNQIIKKRIIHFWVITIIYSIAHIIIYFKTQNYISVWANDFLSVLFLNIIPIYISYYFTKTLYMLKQDNKSSFLTAKWKNLALINYEIDASLLEKYVPKGTEIDLYNGKCYISLVGFLFQDTKLLGLKIPFHINFEEINLRFYVKRFENKEWKRGVVFIKEIVPKPALSFIANTIYKEHYQTLPTKHTITKNKNQNTDFVYQWKTKNKWNTILIETENKDLEIEIGSTSEFITEHYFGYTKHNENKVEMQIHLLHRVGTLTVGGQGDMQVGDIQKASHDRSLRRGFSASLMPSPTRLMASTVKRIAMPGNVHTHQAERRSVRPAPI